MIPPRYRPKTNSVRDDITLPAMGVVDIGYRIGRMDADLDWIRRGLRFECQPDCGLCCTAEAREGSVFLEAEDVERLAGFWNMTPQAFTRKYCVDEYGELALAMDASGSCQFLERGGCTVYEARPLQCRTYPFLPLDGFTPIESPYTWRYEKKFCPGIGKGRLYRKKEIRDITRARVDVNGFEV